jgi:putative lysine transport system permease protein
MDRSKGSATEPPHTGSLKKGTRSRFVAFFVDDHRYVFLGTSVLALVGMWLSGQPRLSMSFLAGAYSTEVAFYYLLLAWVVVSLVALANKLLRWRTYAATSPFKRPGAIRAERICSYAMGAIVAILFVDRVVMGFAAIVSSAISADTNPSDFLSGAVYMVYESRTIFATGILTTIELAFFGTIIAFFLALLVVFLRIQVPDRSDNDAVKFLKIVGCGFAKLYSTVVRGTPMMVQGLIIYFLGFSILKGSGLSVSQIGLIWSTFAAGLVTISLNSTAYMMEVLRGGIESVDSGQSEAARSLGLSQWQAMRKVVFPQGIKYSIPSLSNELVINIKDSSVLSVIGVFDLMFATTTVAGIYYRQMEVYCVAAVCYLILTLVASKILTSLSRRLDIEKPGVVPSSN